MSSTFQAPAEHYDRFMGRYSGKLAPVFLDRVGIEPGQRILDVGCGPGALSGLAAQIVGADHVAAIDPSDTFVEAARARVPGADVRLGGAESLPFDDESFDAVLSQLVVNFIPDAPSGVAEMRRVVKPGGLVAACVWDYAGGMRMLRTFWDAAVAVDPEGAMPAHEGHAMRYSNRRELGDLWSGAGLTGVDVGTIEVEVSYSDFEDLWEPFTTGVGPSGSFAASLDPERQEALRERIRASLGNPEGSFSLSALAWCAVGRR